MGHHCHAEGCSTPCAPKMFTCRSHWSMVPAWLQTALWRVYRPGQENDKRFTYGYLIVQTRCRLAIAHVEGRDDFVRGLVVFLRDVCQKTTQLRPLVEDHDRDDDFVQALDAFILARM
jgi:hypothetical protein